MIGKYYLSIGGTAYPRVSQQRVYKFSRTENKTTSFAGTACVDRSALKYKVESIVALMTLTEKSSLETAAAGITATVGFYDGTTLKSITGIVKIPEWPQPIYKYQNKTNGVYFKDVKIEIEEA